MSHQVSTRIDDITLSSLSTKLVSQMKLWDNSNPNPKYIGQGFFIKKKDIQVIANFFLICKPVER